MTASGPEVLADPVGVAIALVSGIEPGLGQAVIEAAVLSVAGGRAKRRRLAQALTRRPGILTDGRSPAPRGAGDLLMALRNAGATVISPPACAECGKPPRTLQRRGQDWYCTACGQQRVTVSLDRHGQPRCGQCPDRDNRDPLAILTEKVRQVDPSLPAETVTAAARRVFSRPAKLRQLAWVLEDAPGPANRETCAKCGRRRPVSTRTLDGPVCPACRPWKMLVCGICGKHAPCLIAKAADTPWCRACNRRWARCARCGQVRHIRGGTADQPLCSTCTWPEPGFWRSCPGCGQPGRIHTGRCARCTIGQRLREPLGDHAGQIRPELQALYQAVATADRPSTAEAWLNRSAAPAIVRQPAGKKLTHRALGELPAGKPVEHLRAVLVAIGTLPARDEQMARLERWTAQVIADRPGPSQQQLLRRHAVWHVVRRLRARLAGAHATHNQALAAQRNIKAAVALLDWLSARDLTLGTAGQGGLEAWLASAQATHRTDAGNFVRWARRHKLIRLDFAAIRWGWPSGVIDTETRWGQARWLIHDGTLKPEDWLAGLLVLLYAQRASAISRLTLDHIQASGGQIRLRLGSEPVALPEPLATLALQAAAARQGHATIGDPGTSHWPFPGGQPGRPISAYRMTERLRQLGIVSGQARSAALFQLATDLPAAVLARMPGIHIIVAVAWERASDGDWAAYAADVSRRTRYDHEKA